MWPVSWRAALLVLLGADLSAAADVSLLKGLSQYVRGDSFLSMPVGTVDRPPGAKRAANGFEEKLYNMEFFYATDVSKKNLIHSLDILAIFCKWALPLIPLCRSTVNIGSPPQRVTVLVDTGSSELWVNPDCRTSKSSDLAKQCREFGQYDPRRSDSSYGPFGTEDLDYGDASDSTTRTSVSINYYSDVVALGDAKINNQTFGVVTQSQGQSQGILGLAPDLKGGLSPSEPYSLVLDSMAKQGVISSRVFSLDLRRSDDEHGAIMYGGLDKSKFIGPLEKRPIVKGVGGEWRLAVELTTIGVTLSSSSNFAVNGSDANVMLDSGTTMTRMHSAVAAPILRALDAEVDSEGYYQVRCSAKTFGGSVDFGFGKKTIRVPLKKFILNLGDSAGMCYVGMVVTTGQQILGDSVLRAGYFVFDWDNQEVHIAQAANCGNNDIVAVSSGTDAVPSATGHCKEGDAALTGAGGAKSTPTKGRVSTQTRRTVYTVTSCPPIDAACVTALPDSVTLEEFINKPGYGRHPIAESRDPYTCGITGLTRSVAQVARRTDHLARAIAEQLAFDPHEGTEWDRVVCLYSLNTIDYIPLAHAIHRLSGIVTPASAAYSHQELEHQLRSSGAQALFTCVPLLDNALKAADAAGIPRRRVFLLAVPQVASDPSFETIDDLAERGRSLPPLPPLRWIKGQGARQTAFLCYSSGTSGLPVSNRPVPPCAQPLPRPVRARSRGD
ncbi:secreted aspartic proteinase [Metarhizium album ARSEF 1941]|uniref:Secreted aspartic proteinase n=1 Tax=Metarhizium album (strain ARSEF 1941) TaxID=1081103 RepID=A0A0B2WXE3_METAS|nr:secreted aspartic proteinase [Metarhizium album ARSEF 1941]KHN98708.1 secreted aspartic proteinase [Metarhizium album ARSEF 1941]